MANSENRLHALDAAGLLIAFGSALLTVTFIFHGPPKHHAIDQMAVIADEPLRWMTVHWIAAVALSMFTMSGILILVAGSRLTSGVLPTIAWSTFSIGSLWTLMTAVAEATAVTASATAGREAIFAAWWALGEGMANGFAAVAVAVVLVAADELGHRATGVTPAWAAGAATVAGTFSFGSWAAWSWLDYGAAAPVWVVSSIAMCAWLFWFGIGQFVIRETRSARNEI